MTIKEIEAEVQRRKNNGGDMHDTVIRTELLVEQLVGEGGMCAIRGKKIDNLQKALYLAIGGGAVFIFVVKYLI